jgi:hypothetical protein
LGELEEKERERGDHQHRRRNTRLRRRPRNAATFDRQSRIETLAKIR